MINLVHLLLQTILASGTKRVVTRLYLNKNRRPIIVLTNENDYAYELATFQMGGNLIINR